MFPWGWALLRFPPLARREYVGLAAGAVLVVSAFVVVAADVSASDVIVVVPEAVVTVIEPSNVSVTDSSVVVDSSDVSEAIMVVVSPRVVVTDDSVILVTSDVAAEANRYSQ
jgi:hypothetical protein